MITRAQELCRKLRPVLGKKIDGLLSWLRVQVESFGPVFRETPCHTKYRLDRERTPPPPPGE